jgi:hypothetical protein
MPKIRELQDASRVPLFLKWFYFYNMTFEKPVSLDDLMFTPSSPPLELTGFPWYLLAETAVDCGCWRQLCSKAQVQGSTGHTSLEPSLVFSSTPTLQSREQ